MLGAARHIEQRVAHYPGQHAAHQGTGVARRMDVAVVEHGVAEAADLAGRCGLGLGENGNGLTAETGQHTAGGVGVDGVLMTSWSITRSPAQPEALPRTTISLRKSSTPAEVLATLD